MIDKIVELEIKNYTLNLQNVFKIILAISALVIKNEYIAKVILEIIIFTDFFDIIIKDIDIEHFKYAINVVRYKWYLLTSIIAANFIIKVLIYLLVITLTNKYYALIIWAALMVCLISLYNSLFLLIPNNRYKKFLHQAGYAIFASLMLTNKHLYKTDIYKLILILLVTIILIKFLFNWAINTYLSNR